MQAKDRLLALAIIVVWGVNFVVIKVGLVGVPPMLLGALRFCLVAFPAVFFIPRPRIPLRMLVAYGATISLGQFVFLFYAMAVGMPAAGFALSSEKGASRRTICAKAFGLPASTSPCSIWRDSPA